MDDPRERIVKLASAFPSLAHRPEVQDKYVWDAIELDEWAQLASHGERLAVQFILHVWNQHEDWLCGCFDVIEAMQVWDPAHRAGFQAWANEPFVL